MRFFADPSQYTHRIRFYGFPAYASFPDDDGANIEGTNVVWDFCILHVAPVLHWIIDTIRFYQGADEPMPWLIEIVEDMREGRK